MKECVRAKDAFELLEMIPMIDGDKISAKMTESTSLFGVRDIHILLYLAKENFGDHLSLQGVDDNTEELGHDEEQNQIYR